MTEITFLPLTATVSLPFIPSVLKDLRKDFKSSSLIEQAIEENEPSEPIPVSLHARADSSASVLG